MLYRIGTDQVRGFAVTLFVGILMSMFTALYFGRMIFEIAERKRWITSLPMLSILPSGLLEILINRGLADANVLDDPREVELVSLARQQQPALLEDGASHLGELGGQRRRRRPSDYGVQLLEKQRLRFQYNISEKQLARAYKTASRMPGSTGDNLMQVLEGEGMANPANRFHSWLYRTRADVQCIVHSHAPHVAALSMLEVPLEIAHMDTCVLYGQCAFLGKWPGIPVGNEEGEKWINTPRRTDATFAYYARRAEKILHPF